MKAQSESDLVVRGKKKSEKHHLCQISQRLLLAREFRFPLFYKSYSDNLHERRQFAEEMEKLFGIVCGLRKAKERLTMIIDIGTISENKFACLDDQAGCSS